MAAGTALLIFAIAETVLQTKGQLDAGKQAKEAGKAQQRAYDANADVADSQAAQLDYNAQVADLQAADAIDRGRDEESRFRQSVRGLIGSQRAGFAGQGVDVGSGSAVDVQADAARLGEIDALTLRSNAKREAWGFQVQAEDYRRGAVVARKGAAAARVGGQYAAAAGLAAQRQARIGAVTTVLGNGSSLLMQRYGWGNNSSPTTGGLPPAYMRGV